MKLVIPKRGSIARGIYSSCPAKAALAGQVGSKRKSENALTELHFALALAKTCCGTIVL